jgi:hypothetical protein
MFWVMQKTAFFMANLLLRINAFWARDDYQPASRRLMLYDRLQSGICLIGIGREYPASASAMCFVHCRAATDKSVGGGFGYQASNQILRS